jgi:hypothetical protein
VGASFTAEDVAVVEFEAESSGTFSAPFSMSFSTSSILTSRFEPSRATTAAIIWLQKTD